MKDKWLVNHAVSALTEAGLDVVSLDVKENGKLLKLKVIPSDPGPIAAKASAIGKPGRDWEEKCDLMRSLGAQDWRHAFSLVQEFIRVSPAEDLNPGDFIRVEFDVPAASYDGVDFPARHIDGKVEIVEAEDSKVVFNFADIIFKSAINAKDTNKGGFSASALAKYLNKEFLDAMDILGVLLENNEGQYISLPTATELFGAEEYWVPKSNYLDNPFQFDFFKEIKNRIKVWENDTHWYWTSSDSASSAAAFCRCGHAGISTNFGYASSEGGVAPGFCVA